MNFDKNDRILLKGSDPTEEVIDQAKRVNVSEVKNSTSRSDGRPLNSDPRPPKIHPTAIIEEGVSIGAGTSVWDNVHIRRNVSIGENCIIGEKTYIAYDVKIGSAVKINAFVYICAGVTVEDQVMISAGTIFTNDLLPRAFDLDGISIKTSDPTEETLATFVRRGTTIGAGCTIGPGIELGEYSMIGMGSVVTRSVLPYQLVFGNPAKPKGFVCVCGQILVKGEPSETSLTCGKCQREYETGAKGIKHRAWSME